MQIAEEDMRGIKPPFSRHFVCMVGTEPNAEHTDSSRASTHEGIHASGRDDTVDVGQAHVVFEAYGNGMLAVVHGYHHSTFSNISGVWVLRAAACSWWRMQKQTVVFIPCLFVTTTCRTAGS